MGPLLLDLKDLEVPITPSKLCNIGGAREIPNKFGKLGFAKAPSKRKLAAKKVIAAAGKDGKVQLVSQMWQMYLSPVLVSTQILSLGQEVLYEEHKFSSRGLICRFNAVILFRIK